MTPEAIAAFPLLHDQFNPTWDTWADSVGLCRSKAASTEVRFKGSAILITAAIDGQGVVLARRLLVHDDLDAAAFGSCGLMPHRGEPPPPTGATLSVRFTPRVVPGESSREKVDECTHLRWCIGAWCVDAKERSPRRFGVVVCQHFNQPTAADLCSD